MTGRPMRVLCFPKDGENVYLNQFSRGLEEAGLVVEDFNYWRAFFRRYDVVHMHWPDSHVSSASWWRTLGKNVRLFALCGLLRLRRTRIVWTLHNLQPHENSHDHWISRTLFPLWFPHLCTHAISLTPTGRELAQRRFPALARKPVALIPHGHYRDFYPTPPSREEACRQLGLGDAAFTYLYLGGVRPYKNVPELIRAFRQLEASDARLIVAGQAVRGMTPEHLQEAAGGDPRIELRLQVVPDGEIPAWFAVADLVVLPFRSVLNSGSVLLALSMNRPVLAPRMGALPDVQNLVGADWLRLYDGPISASTLAQARDELEACPVSGAPDLRAFDWQRVITETLRVYGHRRTIHRDERQTQPVGDAALGAEDSFRHSAFRS